MTVPAEVGVPTAAAEPVCVVQGLSRRFSSVVANDGVSVSIGPGEVFGVLGPNGAGKSTFVRQVMGLVRPDAGSIMLLGYDVVRRPEVASRVAAYLPQDDVAIGDLAPRRAVELTGRLRGMGRGEARAAAAALADELDLAETADRPIARLSGGQRRLASVATALVGDRRVLVLDEPTTGLDPAARRAVWSAIERRRAAGSTVILVTHNVLEAETVLDRVAVFERGRVIACDTPGRLKAAVSNDVRLDLVWRDEPPWDDPTVARLAEVSEQVGRRWSARLPTDVARAALGELTTGAALAALDDFTLATATLEDVYLALGGVAHDLERT
ncbi:MAG TPA: ABC transporter ATP-binding protein [Mycobacteriales bacterium]|nr:ABC transporter ATP-binding protein [Mycobacteriales bacterium]